MNNFNSIAVFFYGSVRIRIWGDYCERFLNVLAANGIVFRNISKKRENFEITLLKKDFLKLHSLRKNCNIKIKIIKKSGIPFLINKHKFRYGMVIGFIFFALTLSFLSSRLWIFKINGNSSLSETAVKTSLYNLGIKEGMSMKSIDTDILKLKFVLNGENIAWSSFNRQGSVLEVNLTEFDNSENGENTPSNLIAEYDAIIKRIDIQSGTVEVKIGDTVSKGQLLVSGIIDYGSGSSFVSSNGKIIAEVNDTIKITLPKKSINTTYSDDVFKKYNIKVMGLKIPLYLGGIDDKYHKTFKSKNVSLFGGKIPIEFTTIICAKKRENEVLLSKNEALEVLRSRVTEQFSKKNCSDIVILNEKITELENEYDYLCNIKFSKDIAKKEKIIYENG